MPELTQAQRERIARAKAWVVKTCADSDERLLGILDERRDGFDKALQGVNPEQARFSPGEGQWSIEQTLRHIAHANTLCAGLVRMLARGISPDREVAMGVVPEGPEDFDAVKAGLFDSFDALRKASAVLAGNRDPEVTFAHPWFGALNTRQWFVFCFVHSQAHINQVERIKSSTGFPSS